MARSAGHLLLLQDGRLRGQGDPRAVLTGDAIDEIWRLPSRT
ncbi:hypothetical protein [Streptomyces sp. NPDC088746]